MELPAENILDLLFFIFNDLSLPSSGIKGMYLPTISLACTVGNLQFLVIISLVQ
jgi:hypothetical protein